MVSPALIFRQIELGPMGNYIYIIACAHTREAGVVDPAWDVAAILESCRSLDLKLKHILITHAHPDHVNGLEALLEVTGATVWLHSAEVVFIREMADRFQIPIGFMDKYSARIRAVSDEEEIHVGRLQVRCLHTPGHSPGSQCFLVGKNLLSGDTLFVGACGRVDIPGGDPEKLWWSLNRKLWALEDDIVVYPGHNYGNRPSSTLGEQKRSNPYMQYGAADEFLDALGEC